MSCRVYVGNLPSRATERDIEHFFRGYGKIREVMLKNGFGFVEFDDARDADDAVYELNGRDLCGERVVVEISRSRDRGGFRNGGGAGGGRNLRYPPPMQTRYRMLVYNLSTRFSWQDLKDMMRTAGDVTYADAHKRVRNEAIVSFATHKDLLKAMDKFQGKDINGRRIKLVDDSEGGGDSGGRDRDRGDRRRGGRSASRSRTRSRSARRSRTRSPPSRSQSRASSPAKNGDGSDTGKKRSRSRSASSAASSEKK